MMDLFGFRVTLDDLIPSGLAWVQDRHGNGFVLRLDGSQEVRDPSRIYTVAMSRADAQRLGLIPNPEESRE